MRMKLSPLYNYTDHREAARMRDIGTDIPAPEPETDRQLLAQAARTGSIIADEDDSQLDGLTEADSFAVREVCE